MGDIAGRFLVTFKKSGEQQRVKIWYDEYAPDPRKNDNVTHIHTFHPRYTIGDDNGKMDASHFTVQLLNKYGVKARASEGANALRSRLNEIDSIVWYPVVIYDHSGIALSYGSIKQFPDWQWDAGDIGFVYVDKKELEAQGIKDLTDENWKEVAERYIKAEIKELAYYCAGECFGYTEYVVKHAVHHDETKYSDGTKEISDYECDEEIDDPDNNGGGYLGDDPEQILKDIYGEDIEIKEIQENE